MARMSRGTWFPTLAVPAVLALGLPGASADQFWVAYEGNDFPENEGWERHAYGGGCQRSLQDGTLVLDGRASTAISDFYRGYMPVEPAPGDGLCVEWDVSISDVTGAFDPGILVFVAGRGNVFFVYRNDRLYSLLESTWVDFTPGLPHAYQLSSTDLLHYSLYIDGTLSATGQFIGVAEQSYVSWGDETQGASSLSVWDYVRFGSVPEPATGLLLGSAVLAARNRLTRRMRRTSDVLHQVEVHKRNSVTGVDLARLTATEIGRVRRGAAQSAVVFAEWCGSTPAVVSARALCRRFARRGLSRRAHSRASQHC